MQIKLQFFVRELIIWYKANLRNLPWRNTQNPYFIWLSEIILQQTRVEQGMPYYFKFIEKYPTVEALANADEEEVLKLWEGLGYYSRARNLHFAAKTILNEYNGKFPTTYEEIRNLKGVGDYTAAAIASLAFDLPHAVVDGNVYRVMSRYFGIETPIDSTAGKKEFFQLANELIDHTQPGTYNQAVMEFGAIHCTPQQPDCKNCPLQANCFAFHNDMVNMLPVKAKKVKVSNRYFNYFEIEHKGGVYIQRRQGNDIWKGLYEFPMTETETATEDGLPQLPDYLKRSDVVLKHSSNEFKHILTHRRIFAKFYTLISEQPPQKDGLIWVDKQELDNFAFPKLILRYLHKEN